MAIALITCMVIMNVLLIAFIITSVIKLIGECRQGANNYCVTLNKELIYRDSDVIFDKGYSTDNNGAEKSGELVDRLISVKPSQRQLDYAELEYYNFIHFGMNTASGREWGTGKEDPMIFNPYNLDTDQWARTLKQSGSKGIIFTAKHHDGFCLWPSEYTNHSVKYSGYKAGKGDIVAELAASCRKFGLKFGLYLSPWDMHESTYGKDGYNDYFLNQLTELCSNYGELFTLWFDGARGADVTLDPGWDYEWNAYYDLIRKLQPNAVITITGPDVRWVGNEAGVSRVSEWNVVSASKEANPQFQMSPDDAARLQKVSFDSEDTGSRDLLKLFKDLKWYPAEVDVSIHKGWFYHADQSPKELSQLLKIYYKSVGGNSTLLLNIPPDKTGQLDPRDIDRLIEFGDAINNSYSRQITINEVKVGGINAMKCNESAKVILTEDKNTSYSMSDDEYIIDIVFDYSARVKRIDIREDLRYSQRIEAYDLYGKVGDKWQLISNNTNVGNRRTVVIEDKSKIGMTELRIVIRQSRSTPVIRYVGVFE